jgi:hypothetical protein
MVNWSVLETPVTLVGAALVLGVFAFALLGEYRRLFMEDPKAVMSAEVLMGVIAKSGGPGYLAAFLLAGALLFLLSGLYFLLVSIPYVISN